MGTIAGKLNGVIPATTPSGWRIEYTSIPVEACSEKPPLSERRDAAGELDHLEPARDLAHRVGEHLAVLGGEDPREVLSVRVEELADREEELGALRERRRAPRLERLGGVLDRRGDLLRPTRGRPRPSARRGPGRRRGPSVPRFPRPASRRSSGESARCPSRPVVGASASSVIASPPRNLSLSVSRERRCEARGFSDARCRFTSSRRGRPKPSSSATMASVNASKRSRRDVPPIGPWERSAPVSELRWTARPDLGV